MGPKCICCICERNEDECDLIGIICQECANKKKPQ
jgi:hypothetical protein